MNGIFGKTGWWSSSASKSKPSGIKSTSGDSVRHDVSPTNSRGSPGIREELSRTEVKFSADRLKALYSQLTTEPAVNDANSAAIVSALRSISEILIWGDKNDPSVFEYFLEKHMLAYFVSILQQCGVVFARSTTSSAIAQGNPKGEENFESEETTALLQLEIVPTGILSVQAAHHVCTQVLQLLHILFENISEDTSLYFLLSNNFINQIIGCVYDFADDEILAHYISLLKILSAKLNPHTIHFFYNEELSGRADVVNDFPLFSKSLSFFTHSETMVRIASRTVILNIFNVRNLHQPGLSFIKNKEIPCQLMTALSSIMKNQLSQIISSLDEGLIIDGIVDLLPGVKAADQFSDDVHIRQTMLTAWIDRLKQGNHMKDVFEKHVGYLEYINDLTELRVEPLNTSVRTQFLKEYILPYILDPLVKASNILQTSGIVPNWRQIAVGLLLSLLLLNLVALNLSDLTLLFADIHTSTLLKSLCHQLEIFSAVSPARKDDRFPLLILTFLTVILEKTNDQKTIVPVEVTTWLKSYAVSMVARFVQYIPQAGSALCRVIVLKLACNFIELMIVRNPGFILDDQDVAILLDAKEQSCLLIRQFFKNDNAFISLVELEFHIQKAQKPLQIDRFLDRELASLLAFCPHPATRNPLEKSEISSHPIVPVPISKPCNDEKGFPSLSRRWPLNPDEECRYCLCMFFLLRHLSHKVQNCSSPSGDTLVTVTDTIKPSQSSEDMPAPLQSLIVGDVVDIGKCDTILSCTVIPFHTHLATKPQDRSPSPRPPSRRPSQLLFCPSDEEKWVKRFLVIYQWQMFFVEPDNRRLGYAQVKETYALPSVQLLNDKEQRERLICCCSLATSTNHRNHDVNPMVGADQKMMVKSVFLVVQQPLSHRLLTVPNDAPWNMESKYEFCIRVVFDDSIRAMAASTRIRKNQERIRELKLNAINSLLDLPQGVAQSVSQLDGDKNDFQAAASSVSTAPTTTAVLKRSNRDLATAPVRRTPIVIHGGGGSVENAGQTVDATQPFSRSTSRDSKERDVLPVGKDSKPPSGTTTPLLRFDTVSRSGFIERLEDG